MFRFVEIERNGMPRQPIPLGEEARGVSGAMIDFYASTGFTPPWIGYFAVEDGVCVGTCAFKSAPLNGRVEIAYYTFAPFERRGIATRMARQLVAIAAAAQPGILVTAQTLPEECASTTILKQLGFRYAFGVDHPEDGHVWEWHLQTDSTSRAAAGDMER